MPEIVVKQYEQKQSSMLPFEDEGICCRNSVRDVTGVKI